MTTNLNGLIGPCDHEVMSERYTWDWDGESRVSIYDRAAGEGVVLANFPATFQSRDGLRVVDALNAAGGDGRVQVSSHGAGKVSVQVFGVDGSLVLDIVTVA